MKQLKIFGVIILVVFGIALMLVPAVRDAREAANRTSCKCRLKQLGLALHNYHDTYESFPPAYTVDDKGNPLHSWRTLILPFIDQQKLYESIDLSKPWNDPVNSVAYTTVIDTYRCPSTVMDATSTTYMAAVTPESVIRPIQSRKIEEIIDGTSNTLLIVEVSPEKAVHWMTPVDADEQALQKQKVKRTLAHPSGRNGVLADGSVRFLREAMPSEQIHALITVDGNEAVGEF